MYQSVLKEMKRAELQKFAKKRNIKANLKSDTIIELLLKQHSSENTSTFNRNSLQSDFPRRYFCSPLSTISSYESSERGWSTQPAPDSEAAKPITLSDHAIGLDLEDLSLSCTSRVNNDLESDRDVTPVPEFQYPCNSNTTHEGAPFLSSMTSSPKEDADFSKTLDNAADQKMNSGDEQRRSRIMVSMDSCLAAVERLHSSTEELKKIIDMSIQRTSFSYVRHPAWPLVQGSGKEIFQENTDNNEKNRPTRKILNDMVLIPGAMDNSEMCTLDQVGNGFPNFERKRYGGTADDGNRYLPRPRLK